MHVYVGQCPAAVFAQVTDTFNAQVYTEMLHRRRILIPPAWLESVLAAGNILQVYCQKHEATNSLLVRA